MTPIEIERAIAVKINQMEMNAAANGVLAAEIDELSTPEFEANYDAVAVTKAQTKGAEVQKVIAREKVRVASFHAAALAMIATATFPRPRTGK